MNAILLAVISICIWTMTVASECNGTGEWKPDNGGQSLVLNGSTSDKCVAIYWFVSGLDRKNFQDSGAQCNQKFGGHLMDRDVWSMVYERNKEKIPKKYNFFVYLAFNGSSGQTCRVISLHDNKPYPGDVVDCAEVRDGYVCEYPSGSGKDSSMTISTEPSTDTPSMDLGLILGIVGAAVGFLAFLAAIGLIVYCKTRKRKRQSHHTTDRKRTGKDALESEGGATGEESRHPIRAKRSKPSKPKTEPSEEVEVDNSDTTTTGRTKRGTAKKHKVAPKEHKPPKARFRRKLYDSPSHHVRPWPVAKKAQKKVDDHIYDTLKYWTKSEIAKFERNAKAKMGHH